MPPRADGFSGARILAVMAKEFIQLSRDRLTYAMILVMPLMQLLLFGYAINNDPKHLPTVAYVQDHGPFARSVVAALQNSGYFDMTREVHSPREVDQALRTGQAQFAVTIPPDFTRKVVRGQGAQVLIEADGTDPGTTGAAIAAVSQLANRALTQDLKGPLARPATAPPFELVLHSRYNPENISAFNIVPGLLGVVLSMTLVMMTSLGMTRELERGTMEGLLATPVRPIEVMIGKLSPYVGIGVLQTVVVLILARLLFQVPFAGGWDSLIIGTLLFIVGSLALGFLISTAARNQLQAMQMSFFYIMPSILLSGFAFPFRGMPEWAQVAGTFLPVTHFLRVIRGALLKGSGIGETWSSLTVLCVFVLAVTGLAMARYRTTLD
jgi:ABC-2 type transport system permease protein